MSLNTKKLLTALTGIILSVLLLPVQSTLAQNGGFAGSYSRMGFGARGMGMGNAMTAVTQQGIYAHYNPALAANARKNIQLDLSSALMTFDRTLHNLNASIPLPPSAGLSVSLINANVSGIDGRTQSGYHTRELSTNEYQFQTAFGLRASPHVYLGTSVKFNIADYHREVDKATGIGLDLGALVQPHEKLNLAITVKDLFSSYTWETSELYGLQGSRDVINNFPTRFIFGATYEVSPDWIIAGNYEIRSQNSDVIRDNIDIGSGAPVVTSSTHSIQTNSQQIRIGSSYRIHERVTVRAGWQIQELDRSADSGHPSAGFSIHLPFDKFTPSVDYAFVREPSGFSNIHVFSLRFNL